MKIGYPGKLFDIPPPSTGMGFANNSDTETLELDNGGRYIYEAPTAFKSFNMSWRSTTPELQPLIDIYNKRYGTKPFYLQDMLGGKGNILPPRWAYGTQLHSVLGGVGEAIPYGEYMTRIQNNRFSNQNPSIKIPLFVGENHYFAVFGLLPASSPMRYRLCNSAGVWSGWTNIPLTPLGGAPTLVCSRVQSQSYEFIEFQVNLTTTSLYIEHMDFSTDDYRSYDNPYRPAIGVGGLKFSNTLDGDLTMLRAQKIGLSVDMTEVAYE